MQLFKCVQVIPEIRLWASTPTEAPVVNVVSFLSASKVQDISGKSLACWTWAGPFNRPTIRKIPSLRSFLSRPESLGVEFLPRPATGADAAHFHGSNSGGRNRMSGHFWSDLFIFVFFFEVQKKQKTELDVQSPQSHMFSNRFNLSLQDPQGLLYVLGGNDGFAALRSVERFDPSMGRWQAPPEI